MEQNIDVREREFEIDISKILYKMKSKIIIVAIVTVLMGIIAGLCTHFLITPQYSATVKMYVYSNSDRVTTNSTITGNELDAAQDLASLYIYIIESNTVMESVAKDLGLDMTAGQLRRLVSANKAAGTAAIEVTVTSSSAKWSAQIANSIARMAPSEIVRVVKAGGVEIIDYAKTPKSPSSPNLKRNTMFGALIGFIVSFALFFIKELFDTSVTSSKDLEREFNLPILGEIPKLDSIERTNKDTAIDSKIASTIEPPSVSAPIQPSNTILENLKSMNKDEKNEK